LHPGRVCSRFGIRLAFIQSVKKKEREVEIKTYFKEMNQNENQ
jgi:hypothetical protein